ncbi:MAG: DNA polymerase III subunit alpha [bacterium]
MTTFTHLHLHTQYSLLTGAIRVRDLMDRVKEAGMSAVAMTDTGNMFGAVDFYKRAKKAGIKPIVGVEVAVADGPRQAPRTKRAFELVLLARDRAGYANLRTLVSMGWLEGLHGGKPHVDRELLERYRGGVFALSGAVDGEFAQAVLSERPDHARRVAAELRDLFEPGAFHLEVVPSGIAGQDKVNRAALAVGRELGVPLVATNNVHYLERKDARAHEVLMCIGYGRTLDDPDRPRLDVDSLWLKSPDQMRAELGETYADAFERAGWIADQCDVEIELGRVFLPSPPIDEPGHTPPSWLAEVARRGLAARYAEFERIGKTVDRALYDARLEEELGIIIKMEFPGYFLIVQDFINWAKQQDIPVGPGRGSGAGSLVAYALRITDLDPIPYGLLFERFLNPERVSMPDFDIDFCMNRRGEVIEYVTRKYGAMQVGQIATFGGLKARGVIKDVGRVQGFSFGETDRLSKMVPEVLGITLEQALEQEPKLRQAMQDDDRVRDLMDVARALEGLYKSTGMHAAGVVIGEMPLWEYVPVFRGVNGELVTQFAKDEVEEAGLVKFDFLGLKTLTVIDDAVRMVNRGRRGADVLDMAALPLDDPGVYTLISRGDTEGVFQLESSGFQELLKKLRPDKFEDIIAAVALYRPGPLNSGMLDDFIARKHGRQKISYPHPKLSAILEETYGVIVYQEQVMQIAQVLAGFTLGAADLLRRAMGKKKADVMAAQRAIFAEGAAKLNGVDPKLAGDIFDLMEKFAEYGFNKSHSAAYALLTYQTGYLKAHHKVEFMAALLSNDRDNPDKVAKGIRNARKIGIEVLPPDVNRSGADFDAVEGRVLFGMGGVKGVGTTAVDAITEARASEAFASLFDFCERVDLRRVNKKTIEALIKTGAFDFCGHPRARLVAALDAAVERAQNVQRDRAVGQGSLFDMLGGGGGGTGPAEDALPAEVMEITEWPEQELLQNEKSVLGMYVSGHPLDRFAELIERHANCTVENLGRRENFDVVKLGGIVSSVRIRPFKSGDGRMAIMLFEDLTGEVEVIAMGDDFDRYEGLLTSDQPLLLTGKVRIDRDEDRTSISLRLGGRRRNEPAPEEPEVVSLAQLRAARSRRIRLALRARDLDASRVARLRTILHDTRFRGSCETALEITTSAEYGDCTVVLAAPMRLEPSEGLELALHRLFGDACALNYR